MAQSFLPGQGLFRQLRGRSGGAQPRNLASEPQVLCVQSFTSEVVRCEKPKTGPIRATRLRAEDCSLCQTVGDRGVVRIRHPIEIVHNQGLSRTARKGRPASRFCQSLRIHQ